MVPRAVALLSIVAFAIYTRNPHQLIPQNVPLFGYCDDLSILVLGFVAARKLTPREVIGLGDDGGLIGSFERSEVLDRGDRRRSRPISLYDVVGYRNAWRIRSALTAPVRSDSAPIVIGGCGRSGTTLVRTILDRHPAIVCGDESTVFLGRISSPKDIAWRYGIDPDTVADMMRTSRSQAEFVMRFEEACLDYSGKRVWAEKTPENVRRFSFVRRHFPNAHLVHVIRDGRDVVCSLRRQRWFKVPAAERTSIETVDYAIGYWMKRVSAGIKFRGDPLYREVRYEDLIADPDQTLRSLTSALGVEWNPALLTAAVAERTEPHRGRIYGSAVGQWRTELADHEIDLIERKAGPLLRQLGYSV